MVERYATTNPDFEPVPAAAHGGCEGCVFTRRSGCFLHHCNGAYFPVQHPLHGKGALIWVAKEKQ
jgi:hypothetical protein